MASSSSSETLPNGLRDVQRFITDHNSEGKAIFSKDIPSTSAWKEISPEFNFFLAYTTKGFPVNLNAAKAGDVPVDVQNYEKDLNGPPAGLSLGNGTVLRFVDFAPDSAAYMHRTESIDYGVVLEGALEIQLDSGEMRIMNRGDVCVQRATMHAWKNITENGGWARMMFVLVSSEKVVVGGQELGENLPGKLGEKVTGKDL
ncbi:related to Cupin domain protein [Phialocephala subalpina]|uniref:Related to Cupin domain protein n=1 Tax=Phialocephala subalpina TaxID=576137 RepID=A0A1L7WQ54_9HELO|nr:related to Cupin domain protein [Phialocephala subalpina]